MTTFNRPAALARSLPQVANLGYRVIVVDDGSTGAAGRENAAICERYQARRLALPDNRGLAAAMNVGFAYVMADPAVEWISYFQDDVDVTPGVMDDLRAIADRHQRPLVTAYDSHQHPTERQEEVAGRSVKLKRSSPAVHLHGHVDYWKSVMPIPSEYVGAPRRRWEASLEDYWIVNHADAALTKRGLLIASLPDRVRTFLFHAGDSTWDNPNRADPPLKPPH
jgi:glycosyltransferase involved in cell wall biosynthesis